MQTKADGTVVAQNRIIRFFASPIPNTKLYHYERDFSNKQIP